jgi:DNA-binding MarR family transcriptional regulator
MDPPSRVGTDRPENRAGESGGHSLDSTLGRVILEMHMQVKSGSTESLDLSGTGSCAAFNFRRTARAVTRLYDLGLEPAGIRSTQFTILTAVAKYQPIAIGRVGEILILDQTTLTRSLRLLQKQGLLQVSPRSLRRQRFLTLTDKAVKVLEVAVPLWRKVQAEFLTSMGSEQWKEFRNELERLSRMASEMDGAGRKRNHNR